LLLLLLLLLLISGNYAIRQKFITARQAVGAVSHTERYNSYRRDVCPSVRQSVCLSLPGIMSKQPNV